MANTNTKTAAEAVQGGDNSADLQKQVDALTAENAQLKGQVISLTADRDTLATANKSLAMTNESLASDKAYVEEQLEAKTEELEEAEALIEEQSGRLAAAEVGQAEGPVIVTHDKAQYRVLAPKFSHKGLDVDAHTLRQNPDLVRELVEANSGLLQKVEAAA
ncbi:MAG: hypothetical protein ACRYF0_22025 [Janthinobacterium lividum]